MWLLFALLGHGCSSRPSGWERIETATARVICVSSVSSSRPSGWERIETPLTSWPERSVRVAPGLRAGRGLKPVIASTVSAVPNVAPGLRAGRGLKPSTWQQYPCPGCSSRPSGWERIETYRTWIWQSLCRSSSRPSGWERIETYRNRLHKSRNRVAPGLRAGRGLKPSVKIYERSVMNVAPGLRAGRGLKQKDTEEIIALAR